MTTIAFRLIVMQVFVGMTVYAQQGDIPHVDIYTMDGCSVNTNEIFSEGKPLILIFWRTYDKDGIDQLTVLNEFCDNYTQSLEVRIVAICIDGIGKVDHVKPFIHGYGFEMEVYIDKNGEFKRAMNITDSPCVMVVDQDKNISFRYGSYCVGVEEVIVRKVGECVERVGQ